jgi:lathosterol oxidase
MAAEKGWTKSYPRVDNVGLPLYFFYFFAYMACVEFCVYWMHRMLHEVTWAYKLLHHDHHKYNKEHTLSPFAGLAFHPIDGIVQVGVSAFLFFSGRNSANGRIRLYFDLEHSSTHSVDV